MNKWLQNGYSGDVVVTNGGIGQQNLELSVTVPYAGLVRVVAKIYGYYPWSSQ